MDDLISRQAAIDEIINLWADKPFGNPALVEIKDCIEKLSPVTLQPCGDAISREELLKAIDTWDKFGYTETGCFVREPKGDYVPYIHYDDVIKSINGMPPVTPKFTDAEIQKMQDLEFAEIQKAYEIGKAENPNRWVSVIEDIKSEINELSELDHIEPTYEDCKRDVLEILDKYKASPTGEEVKE